MSSIDVSSRIAIAVSLSLVLCLASACRRAGPPGEAALPDTGYRTPESVLFDPRGDVYLVSNINGSPLAKDDDGFISLLGPDGAVRVWRWIDGADSAVTLHAPKGMGISGDTIFVADIDVVRLFHRGTGSPLGEWPVPGAAFLNDVAVGSDGTVYVTDTGFRVGGDGFEPSGTDAVWRFEPGGVAEPVLRGAGVNGPNGIWADSSGLIVLAYAAGEAFRVDAAGRRTSLPRPPAGGLDGVVRANDGSLLVSSWEGSAIYRLAPGASSWAVAFDSLEAPADIGWDSRRGVLLTPLFRANRVLLDTLR